MPNQYLQHIRSARWRNMRKDMARLRNHRCERCGNGPPLHLHHKTYDRLGRELISDLEVLCCQCHRAADGERAKQASA
jgi:5-methylcytosine-specific restriction endonuclease McrA